MYFVNKIVKVPDVKQKSSIEFMVLGSIGPILVFHLSNKQSIIQSPVFTPRVCNFYTLIIILKLSPITRTPLYGQSKSLG
ncbi:hypothetical protein L1987_08155 [Smallanthus sonchifolius]|uniref:Uncharacterized protein n=1 Tax=Smallanthus sonchifolius TaxID=185202 RepID=A0ACB9JKE6_9ASTR|nr:hypothetical protein L1987_08155 [Smallanthus sonchifolius]